MSSASASKGLQSVLKSKVLPQGSKAALAEFIAKTTDADLKGLPDVEPVLVEKLTRPKIAARCAHKGSRRACEAQRRASARSFIFKMLQRSSTPAKVPATPLRNSPSSFTPTIPVSSPGTPLQLKALAKDAKTAPVKRSAFAMLVFAARSPDSVWTENASDGGQLNYLVESIALIPASEANAALCQIPTASHQAACNEGKIEWRTPSRRARSPCL
jgi:hypothetical protein